MNRGSFLKSLLGLIIAPSIIKDINWAVPKVQATGCLFSELNLLIPIYYADYIRKYGSESYTLAKEILGNVNESETIINENTFKFQKGYTL